MIILNGIVWAIYTTFIVAYQMRCASSIPSQLPTAKAAPETSKQPQAQSRNKLS